MSLAPQARDEGVPSQDAPPSARSDRGSGPRARPGHAGSIRPGSARALVAWVPVSVMMGLFFELVFLIVLAATDGYDAARSGEVARVLLTFVTVAAMFLPIHMAFAKRPRLEIAVTCVVFLLFVAANLAKQVTVGSFDYGFVHDNVQEVFTPLGWHILASNVGWPGLAALLGVPAVSGLVLARAPKEPWAGGPRARLGVGAASVVLLVGLPVLRVSTHESLTAFVASGVRFHARERAAQALVQGDTYPYVRDFVPSERARAIAGTAVDASRGKRPHVIVLFLESWNGLFVDKTRPDGKPYTPVFDARRREGLAFDFFYGNSMQSSRGHFATLCSLPPIFRGKEFTDFKATHFHCLPEVLKEAGYGTIFYSATAEPDFEGGKVFFERIGFDHAEFQDPAEVGKNPLFWGTGLQDDAFYKALFARIDRAIAERPDAPVFAVAANTSNHYPFRERPGHVTASGESTKRRGDYVASLGAADAWLATFFDELERRPALRDAIVVITGDHSFPADEHGIHFNGLGSYEEAFRTGVMVRWPGHVRPELVKDRAASQIDLAPTITDLLQLRHKTHFVGQSLVAGEPPQPAPMVQPYDGVRLVAVQWPFKLVRHEAAEQEQLYDLATDPREEHDLLEIGATAATTGGGGGGAGAGGGAALPALRKAILRIHANQALLRADRVWPAAP